MDNILTLTIAVAAIFVSWVAKQIFYKRRLFCVVTRFFEYSSISDSSNTAEIIVVNAGRKSEEDVQIKLAPGFTYSVLASTNVETNIEKNGHIKIARLAPKQQVGLIFLAEGNERFKKEHVAGISSKEISGKITNNFSDTQVSGPQVAGIMFLLFCVFGLCGFFLISLATDMLGPWIDNKLYPPIDQRYTLGCVNTLSNAFDVKPPQDSKAVTKDMLKALAADSIEINRIFRSHDNVFVEAKLTNKIAAHITYSLRLRSPAADSTVRSLAKPENFIYDIVLIKENQTKTLTVGNFLPADFDPQVFWLDLRMEIDGGHWINYERRIAFGADSGLKCGVSDPTK